MPAVGRVRIVNGSAFLALAPDDRLVALDRLNAAELWTLLEDLRAHHERGEYVPRAWRGHVWRAWYAYLVRVGRDPQALRRNSADEVEAFWAHVIPGLDGCLIWDGPAKFQHVTNGRHVDQIPARWAWRRAGRVIPVGSMWRIVTVCGSPSCVNIEHLQLVKADRRRYDDERLLGALQALALRLGHTPTTVEWKAARWKPTPDLLSNRWGSWAGACRAAGLEPPRSASPQGRKYDDDQQLLRDLAAFAAERGFAPTEDEWNASGSKPSGTTFRRRFKSWGRAREAAGLPRRSHVLADDPMRKYARGLRRLPTGAYLADESLDDVQRRLYEESRA